jgi:glycerate-2-kinase
VIGNDFGTIASGPFYSSPSSSTEAVETLKKYKLWDYPTKLPNNVKNVLEEKIGIMEKNTFLDNSLSKNKPIHYLLGSNKVACQAVREEGIRLGFNSIFLTNQLEGDARYLGRILARIYDGIVSSLPHPLLVVSGGESTVKVTGDGTGGRNQELAAALLEKVRLDDLKFAFLSCGTDGIDGNSGFAGVIIDNFSIKTYLKKGFTLSYFQEQNDTTRFFQELGGCLILTGPTGTNVMDIQIALIG